MQRSVGRPGGRSQEKTPLEALWSNGNHTHGVNSRAARKKGGKEQHELQKITTKQKQSGKACWKVQMQRAKGKERGSPRHAGNICTTKDFRKKKETLPPPSPCKQLKVHFQTDRNSKKINASSSPLPSPPAIQLRLLVNMSLLRTGC